MPSAPIQLVQDSFNFDAQVTIFIGKNETEEQIKNRKRDLLVNINRMIKNIGMIVEIRNVPVATSST